MDELFKLGKGIMKGGSSSHGSYGGGYPPSHGGYPPPQDYYGQPPPNPGYQGGAYGNPYGGYPAPGGPQYGYGDPYQPNPYQQNPYQQNPYQPNPYQQPPPHGGAYGNPYGQVGAYGGGHAGGTNPLALLKTFDRDGDGQITERDFVLAAKQLGLGKIGETVMKTAFRRFDKNRNGRLELNEALAAITSLQKSSGGSHGHY